MNNPSIEQIPFVLFNGERYSPDKNGYWRNKNRKNTKLLHREVWKSYYGEIPDSHHIHHIDENPSNNAIENLECLYSGLHHRLHKGNPVKRLDTGETFLAMQEAENHFGISHGSIRRSILKGWKCAGTYWEFINEST